MCGLFSNHSTARVPDLTHKPSQLHAFKDHTSLLSSLFPTLLQHLAKHFGLHATAQLAALFALGGLPALVWVGAVRLVVVYHITWFVNSAAHVWGSQSYRTGDLSRNNWWVGLLAFGEGWHNNHHAFEFSARHGLEWWQIDATWLVIRGLQSIGLATNVKLPSEAQKAKLAL
uniref:Fatty acid desaturase domain-containing protein n=1 Tax=Auxenochlorella protothecoides TaxID=3075 RepID=A0A1D1ZZP6_AUXPR